jgi:hypothetical protein
MGDLEVMSASMESDTDIAPVREDLVILKRDVGSLIDHINAQRSGCCAISRID